MRELSGEIKNRLRPTIEAITRRVLEKYTAPHSRTLEVGCGPGQYRLAVRGKYVGVDLTINDYNETLPRTPDVLANAIQLPFQDGCFNVVFFSNVFYHFDDGNAALIEALRTLSSEGHLLIFDYSKTTVERLRVAYGKSCPEAHAHPRSCREWIELLNQVGIARADLYWKRLPLNWQWLNLLGWRWWGPMMYELIDCREGEIVLVARKNGNSRV